MIAEGICPTVAPKILAAFQHKKKLNKFNIVTKIEINNVVL